MVSSRRGRGSRRWPGKQEVAGAASVLATHLFVLLAEEEDDKGEEVGWAGQVGKLGRFWWAARVRPGKSFSLSFIYCFLFFFCFI